MNFIQFTNHIHYSLEENHFNWKIQDCTYHFSVKETQVPVFWSQVQKPEFVI